MESKYKMSDSRLSVTLHTNYLKKDGSYFGRVSRNVVSLNNLIADLEALGTPGIDSFAIEHSAELLKKAVLFNLEQGKCVDLFGLGVLYISTAGRKNRIQPGDSSVKGFSVRFRPSEAVQKAAENIQVDKIVLADNSPVLNEVASTWQAARKGELPLGKVVRIRGNNLKLGTKESGIYFVPAAANGATEQDEAKWTKVPPSLVSRNKPTELEFYLPAEIPFASYYLAVKTNYGGPVAELKNYARGTSKSSIMVVE